MTTDQKTDHLAQLDALLAAYGANRARWPAGAAASIEILVTTDPAARRLLHEAAALDAVLTDGPEAATPATDALADRIMAALPARATASPNVVSLASARSSLTAKARQTSQQSPARRVPSLRAAALLAASLLIGMIAGVAGHDTGLLHEVTARLGVAGLVGNDVAWNTDTHATGDEEDIM